MRCIVTDGFCDFLNLSSNISTKVFALSHLSLEFRVQLTRKIKSTYNFCNGNQRDCAHYVINAKSKVKKKKWKKISAGCHPLQSGLQDETTIGFDHEA